jgi:hypothetical protein
MTGEDEPRVQPASDARFSPKFARAERRRGILFGLGFSLLSCVPFIDASIAIKRHEQVNLGSASNYFFVPPWVAILFGVLLALLGCAVMYVSIDRGRS